MAGGTKEKERRETAVANAPIRKGKLQGRNAHCPTSSAKPGNGTQRKSRRGSTTSLSPSKGKKNRKSPGSKNNRSKGRLAKNAAKAEAKYGKPQNQDKHK